MKFITLSAAAAAMAALCAAPAVAQESWAGGYIGVFGGGAVADDSSAEILKFDRDLNGTFSDTVRTGAGADAFSPGFCGGDSNGNAAAAGCDDDSTGVEGGIRAGYDWQFGNIVVGAVGELAAMNVEDSATGFSVTPAAYTFDRKLESLAAIRARVGYAFGPALVYGTGGYAVGKVENSFFSTNRANSFTATVDEDGVDGWQAGGGVEYRLTPSFSITGEYLYSSLTADDYIIRVGQGTAPPTNPFILPPNTTGTDMIRSNDKFRVHAVRIGMNYRF